MKWFEPLIAIVAIGLVLLPIILKIVDKKKRKAKCSCGCDCSSCDKECLANFKAYLESRKQS